MTLVPLAAASASPASGSADSLTLRPMPSGSVRFASVSHGWLSVRAVLYGLTPGSSHYVDLVQPSGRRVVRFATLTASSLGRADELLASTYGGRVPRGSRLVIRMGAGRGTVANLPIAETRPLGSAHFWRTQPLHAVEVGSNGVHYGTPRGRAAIRYNSKLHTLTVIISATGITPGPHAAHIHLGSCQKQGPVLYMLRDLIANRRGQIVRAVRVFRHISSPIPATGWYLNIHQGNSGDILRNGQPTIYFRPLICGNIKGGRGLYS
jgi:hypothetical protein